MTFLDQQLDPVYSYGCQFGLSYTTLVISVPSRAEQRIGQCSRAYRSATLAFEDYSMEMMQGMRDFFISVRGKKIGFRAKDWFDYKAVAEPLVVVSVGDGTYQAQLIRTYDRFGEPEVRPITKPQQSKVPVSLTLNGSPLSTSRWTLNPNTGLVTFPSNPSGTVQWTGEFDTPVRFDFDDMMATLSDFNIMEWDSVKLLEIPVKHA